MKCAFGTEKPSRFAQLAEVGVAQHPGIAQRRREDDLLNQGVDDLVAALVLLKLDLGLRRREKLQCARAQDLDQPLADLFTAGCTDSTQPDQWMRVVVPSLDVSRTGRRGWIFPAKRLAKAQEPVDLDGALGDDVIAAELPVSIPVNCDCPCRCHLDFPPLG